MNREKWECVQYLTVLSSLFLLGLTLMRLSMRKRTRFSIPALALVKSFELKVVLSIIISKDVTLWIVSGNLGYMYYVVVIIQQYVLLSSDEGTPGGVLVTVTVWIPGEDHQCTIHHYPSCIDTKDSCQLYNR